MDVVSLCLQPDVVCREVPGEDDVVEVLVVELDVPQSGVQGPGWEVTVIVSPVLSTSLAVGGGGKGGQTTDGILAVHCRPHTAVRGSLEDEAAY